MARSSLGRRKRMVLRAGFGLVTAVLLFATIRAFQIQAGLSQEAIEIYRHHARQDEVLHVLRRTLWLGASACRDFLLNTRPEREATFAAQLREFRITSRGLLDKLDPSAGARPEIESFWTALEAVPAKTRGMNAAARYDFVQREIAPRRSAVGDVVQVFAAASEKAFEDSEARFSRTQAAAENRLFLTLGVSVLLGLLVASASLVRAEGLERQSARQYRELQQLSARLMEVQEQERTRLARELHDEIVQTLATLRLEISRAEPLAPPEASGRLASARALAENAIQATRNISLLLRPSLLDDLGLAPALQWQAEEFSRRTGVPCHLREEGLEGTLPEAVRTCVYRVLQEALHNCEKHAAATAVQVSVTQSRGALTLTVSDNGRGFSPETAGGGRMGILGMQERAGALGGALEIDSSPGAGARLTLRLPLALGAAASGSH